MKKLLPFASVSWLALTLSACGGDDSDPPRTNVDSNLPDTEVPITDVETPPETPPAVTDRDLDNTEVDPPLEVIPPEIVTPPALPGFELSWRSCGTTGTRAVQCAELQVPLDYDDPDGERILISLNRIQTPPGVEHRGSVLYNPGGPGGSGKEIGRAFASIGAFDVVAPGFDIIGFDPRGVGESSALDCEYVDAYLRGEAGDTPPADAMMEAASEYGIEGLIEDLAWLSGECRAYWGNLFDHMGSNQVVRDIERIREALGEEKLNFFGQSYGTRLGALYAQQYPDRVRAVVLDAPVLPRASIVDQVQGNFDELVVVHEAFFGECDAGRISCPPNARELFDAYLTSADSLQILPQMLGLWEFALSYSFATTYLPFILQQQAAQPTPEWMYGELSRFGGEDGAIIQLNNVNCADNAATLLTLPEIEARLDDAFELSPLFGGDLFPIVTCNGWSVEPDPVAPLTAPGAPPLLVIGGTHDFRTPGKWALDMADSLENAVLLTSEHWGHTIVGDNSSCVNDAVRNYFVDLVLPAAGTVCPFPQQ